MGRHNRLGDFLFGGAVASEAGFDADALVWYLDARITGLPLDPQRSPRENMLSYNLMQVRAFPCTPDMQ